MTDDGIDPVEKKAYERVKEEAGKLAAAAVDTYALKDRERPFGNLHFTTDGALFLAAIDRYGCYREAQGARRGIGGAPCESEWVRDEDLTCLQAREKYQRDPDATFPMCYRCQSVLRCEATLLAVAQEIMTGGE